ncbi:MAG: hypothetical protein PHX13_12330 [Thiovulaceae bacterium]|nr:hypothetical protein [Sulfurimonadaceae bacterium]
MKHIKFLIFIIVLLISSANQAQSSKEEFLKDLKHSGGIYQIYDYTKTKSTPAPEGYKPFYISHYGRHGSRWIQTPLSYTAPLAILKEAHEAGKLSALGESLYGRLIIIADDAFGRYGDLSPLGVEEHKEIAGRMFTSFPEIFSTENGRKCFIYSRSTVVPRCIISMAANNERLKELNPKIEITREAYARNSYLNNSYSNVKKDSSTLIINNFLKKHLDVNKIINRIFSDTVYTKSHLTNPISFVRDLNLINSDLLDVKHLNISMADVLSPDELFVLWQAANLNMYYTCGPSAINGKVAMDSSKLLLNDIIKCADIAIEKGNISADLRFGHDTYIIPLLALMDVKGMNVIENNPEKVYQVWSDFKVSPMGANLQIVFFRNKKSRDVIVKILHNEKEIEIPVKTDIAPFYHWKDVQEYYKKKLN